MSNTNETLTVALVSLVQAFADVGTRIQQQQQQALKASGVRPPARASTVQVPVRTSTPAPAPAPAPARPDRTEELEQKIRTLEKGQEQMTAILKQQSELLAVLLNNPTTTLKVVNDD